ncbi:MAG TPA: hypothetical protein PK537_04590 [Candidatus Limiplasma sp.]|nr:hypothetical protein [Candidatus Limiplasma sp.]
MKRILGITVCLLLLVTGAVAQTVPQAEPLCGEVFYPQGSTANTASFVFRYQLPQFSSDQPQCDAINACFATYADTLISTVIPDTVSTLDTLPADGEPAYSVELNYSVTASTDAYLSVLLVSQKFLGNTLLESWEAKVFAVSGIYAGQQISLSQAIGLEQTEGEQAADTASELVYGLVWQIVQYEIGAMQKAYFPDVTEDDLRRVFAPQTDFYLDENGNLVFFIQAGTIAGEVEGVLTYPFMAAELLSAVSVD